MTEYESYQSSPHSNIQSHYDMGSQNSDSVKCTSANCGEGRKKTAMSRTLKNFPLQAFEKMSKKLNTMHD